MALLHPPSTAHLKKNLILQCFHTLRENTHFVKEGSSRTNYEAFWDQLNDGFSLSARGPYKPSNSNVEAFYRGTMASERFLEDVEENVIKKAQDKLDTNLDPLLTISWNVYSSNSHRRDVCERIPRLCGRQMWAIYNKLDVDCQGFVHINDITELVLKIFFLNGKCEEAKNIYEWFSEQSCVDFWSIFSVLVGNHSLLLKIHIVQSLYEEIVHEILKQGKMTKKGHKVQTWKDRWFVLTSTNLYYYESLENRIQKGVVTINSNTKVTHLPSIKGRNYLFRVTDGTSNRAYDISASDPQMLKDWIEAIQVVVAAQLEQGRNLIHRLSLSRAKLFPTEARLPSYNGPALTDYNEGIYRIVTPTTSSTIGREPIPSSGPPTTDFNSHSTSLLPDMPPLNDPSPPTHVSPLGEGICSTSPNKTEQQKKQGPPVYPYPYRKISGPSHVNVDGHDYAVVDKERDLSPPPPPLPKPRDTRVSEGGPFSPARSSQPPLRDAKGGPFSPGSSSQPPLPKPRDSRVSDERPFSPSQPPLPKPRDSRVSDERPFSPSQPPLPKPRDTRVSDEKSFSPGSSSQPQKLGLEGPAPKPRNNLCATKSVPITSISQDSHGSYAQLTFENMTPTDEESEIACKPPQQQAVKLPSSARMRYGYSDVIVSPLVTKDVDKALELKANKPAPLPPTRYESTASKRNSLSDSVLLITTYNSTDSVPTPSREGHTYQNVHYSPQHNTAGADNNNSSDEETPPPPVPRRMESYRPTDLLGGGIPDLTPSINPSGPPLPRARRQGTSPSPLPPLPPR